ncbi:MAG: hypothetical protein QG670_1392 [Thermoproteota archaeon]|nr:hypothetical protein [Thermoproteota archaeon]
MFEKKFRKLNKSDLYKFLNTKTEFVVLIREIIEEGTD